ncbi:MAG: RnfABCDGE type electron transport complex subunit D [Clostridia bacterium]|nr:RnfABCDGE type electron transport complex subunit D [Clostridia bacterium]
MADMTLSITQDFHDRERALDWLTGLFPVLVLALINHGWRAAGLVLLTTAGYLGAAVGLQRLGVLTCKTVPALATALAIAFFLPASAPLWIAAIAGGIAAGIAAVPAALSRRFEGMPFARPLLSPALVGYLFVRSVFPRMIGAYTLPAQWTTPDGEAASTALEGLFNPAVAVERWRLFFGIYPGGMGETCTAVLLLAIGYLLLRRRIRIVPVACMVATVSLLSLFVWGSPLYGVLAGGTVLAALLLGDRTTAPEDYGSQTAMGVVAGTVTVILRAAARTDGTVIAALAACALAPLYPPAGRLLKRFGEWVYRSAKPLFAKIKTFSAKNKNNG